MYNIIFYIYEFGVFVASFFSAEIRKMWRGERAAFQMLKEQIAPKGEYVWFHAASLGEFEQGRPVMEEYRRHFPQRKILLTFFSPSGYEVRKDYSGADVICYLPIDTPTNAWRFLRLVKPTAAFFIKYEFWYNYVRILHHRGVPIYSISSIFRKEQAFFHWYGRVYSHILRYYTYFFVQNEESKTLLHSIGIDNVDVVGDTRFDRVAEIARNSKEIPIVECFKNNKQLFIAGSSWIPDEEILIPYFAKRKGWKLIIAPHVISEYHIDKIMALLADRKVVRFTQLPTDKRVLKSADVLIIDCFGLLSSIYKYANVAYIGGGFGVGIHNLPEAAVWNVPVIFGPNNHKFREAQELKHCHGGFEITDAEDFNRLMDGLRHNSSFRKACADAAGNYVRSQVGATEKILRVIN